MQWIRPDLVHGAVVVVDHDRRDGTICVRSNSTSRSLPSTFPSVWATSPRARCSSPCRGCPAWPAPPLSSGHWTWSQCSCDFHKISADLGMKVPDFLWNLSTKLSNWTEPKKRILDDNKFKSEFKLNHSMLMVLKYFHAWNLKPIFHCLYFFVFIVFIFTNLWIVDQEARGWYPGMESWHVAGAVPHH